MSESGNGPPPPLAAQISPQNFIRGHLPKRGETRADGGEEKKNANQKHRTQQLFSTLLKRKL